MTDAPAPPPGLSLSPRQHAMLLEMGVRLWLPTPKPQTLCPAPAAPGAATAPPAMPRSAIPATATAPSRPHPAPAPLAAPRSAPPAAHPPTHKEAPEHASARLSPPRALYPPGAHPAPAPAPAQAAPCWLLLAEHLDATARLADTGTALLHNMLRAVDLYGQPSVFLAHPAPAPQAGPQAATAPPEDLQAALKTLRPAVVLLMGHAAVRYGLGRSEPLEQLRGQVFHLDGVPAIVTYDAPMLLRAPARKPGAWEDLCRARALAAGAPAGT